MDTQNSKICTKCLESKDLIDFGNNKRGLGGKRSACQKCENARMRVWKKANRDKANSYERKYYANNLEKSRTYNQKKSKKPEYVTKRNDRLSKRASSDINFKLSRNLRTRLYNAVSNSQKSGSAVDDLGCSIEELKRRLESLWTDEMNWANYGIHGWHIDHIEPLCSFDLTIREQLLKACHYTNLRPAWSVENLSKASEDKKKSLRNKSK